jgi:lipopolysaccharide/colanic/teichoic acid biosynthesis glycosyltransferase
MEDRKPMKFRLQGSRTVQERYEALDAEGEDHRAARRKGFWIGIAIAVLFSPMIFAVAVVVMLALGAPLFVFGFLGNPGQWNRKRRR